MVEHSKSQSTQPNNLSRCTVPPCIYLSVADKLGEDALSRAALELPLGAALDVPVVGVRAGGGEGEGGRAVQLLEWPEAGKYKCEKMLGLLYLYQRGIFKIHVVVSCLHDPEKNIKDR